MLNPSSCRSIWPTRIWQDPRLPPLRRCRWRINGRGNAAEVLGLHPNTLRNRMKKFGIQRPKGHVAFDPGRLSA